MRLEKQRSLNCSVKKLGPTIYAIGPPVGGRNGSEAVKFLLLLLLAVAVVQLLGDEGVGWFEITIIRSCTIGGGGDWLEALKMRIGVTIEMNKRWNGITIENFGKNL